MKLEGFEDCSAILRMGVYALCHAGRVVYVGKAKCGVARVAAHRQNRGKRIPFNMQSLPKGILFDEVHFLPCHPDRIDEVERQMIDRYRPRLNVKLKPAYGTPVASPIPLRFDDVVLLLGGVSAPPPAGPKIRRRPIGVAA